MLFLKQPSKFCHFAINQQPHVILTQTRSQKSKLKPYLCNYGKFLSDCLKKSDSWWKINCNNSKWLPIASKLEAANSNYHHYYVKTEIIESTAPPQLPYKQGTIFWETLYYGDHYILLKCRHRKLGMDVAKGTHIGLINNVRSVYPRHQETH